MVRRCCRIAPRRRDLADIQDQGWNKAAERLSMIARMRPQPNPRGKVAQSIRRFRRTGLAWTRKDACIELVSDT